MESRELVEVLSFVVNIGDEVMLSICEVVVISRVSEAVDPCLVKELSPLVVDSGRDEASLSVLVFDSGRDEPSVSMLVFSLLIFVMTVEDDITTGSEVVEKCVIEDADSGRDELSVSTLVLSLLVSIVTTVEDDIITGSEVVEKRSVVSVDSAEATLSLRTVGS